SFPLRLSVCGPALVTRLPDSASGTCFAGPHFPWSPPLAPPPPPRWRPPQIALRQPLHQRPPRQRLDEILGLDRRQLPASEQCQKWLVPLHRDARSSVRPAPPRNAAPARSP